MTEIKPEGEEGERGQQGHEMQVGKVTKKHTITGVYREKMKVQELIRETERKTKKKHYRYVFNSHAVQLPGRPTE